MSWIISQLNALSYGQIHVMELGVAIGLLAATFYRSDRYAAYAVMGLSLGIIVLQRALQSVPDVTAATYRIASMPEYFVFPMLLAFSTGVGITRLIRSWLSEPDASPPSEHPDR